MAETIYDDLLRTGQELLQFRGYLDTQDKQAQLKLQNSFNTQRNGIVYDLLQRGLTASEATEAVTNDFTAIRADTDEYLTPVVDHVEAELVARIESEGGKSPLRRRIVKWAPLAIAVVLLAFYVGVRFYSAVPIDRPIETRAGIEQRATAFKKALRHQDWTNTRRHRMVAEMLAWPIAPTDAEARGASEFAGLVLGGRVALAQAHAICGEPASNAQISDADIQLVHRVADHVLKPGITWRTPPAFTLLPPIQESYPCK